jgi:hypothetical protein
MTQQKLEQTAPGSEKFKNPGNAKVNAYLSALVAVGIEHGFSLSHEDGHGSFRVQPRDEYNDEWLLWAADETQ